MKPESKKKASVASCYDLDDLGKALDTVDQGKLIESRPVADSTFDLSNLSHELRVVNAKLRESGKIKKGIGKLEWRQNQLEYNHDNKGKGNKKKTKAELIAKSRLIVESLERRLHLLINPQSQSITEFIDRGLNAVSDPKPDFFYLFKKFRRRPQGRRLDKLASPPNFVIPDPKAAEGEEVHSNLHSDPLHQVE